MSDNEFFAAAGAALMGQEDSVEAHLAKDTFNGVKVVVQKLITSHQDTQQEEKTKMANCGKDLAAKDDEKAKTTDDLAAVKANIDKKTAEVIQLEDEIKTLNTAIADIKSAFAKAKKIRLE